MLPCLACSGTRRWIIGTTDAEVPRATGRGRFAVKLPPMTNDVSRIAHGGKALYGARVGILMLEARFPRIPGDMGNALTWPFPVLYKVVPGASPRRVVFDKAEGLLDGFLDAAAELVRLGADGITTTCGFLSLYQREISAHVGVPVATSSLMQVPLIERVLPPRKRVGVLTVSAASLKTDHLVEAGADPGIPVVGSAPAATRCSGVRLAALTVKTPT